MRGVSVRILQHDVCQTNTDVLGCATESFDHSCDGDGATLMVITRQLSQFGSTRANVPTASHRTRNAARSRFVASMKLLASELLVKKEM